MKCLVLTAALGNGPEGGMRECDIDCHFHYWWEGEIEGMVGKQKVSSCRLNSLANNLAERLDRM